MAKSRNRKDHKKKVRRRKEKFDELVNSYYKAKKKEMMAEEVSELAQKGKQMGIADESGKILNENEKLVQAFVQNSKLNNGETTSGSLLHNPYGK